MLSSRLFLCRDGKAVPPEWLLERVPRARRRAHGACWEICIFFLFMFEMLEAPAGYVILNLLLIE